MNRYCTFIFYIIISIYSFAGDVNNYLYTNSQSGKLYISINGEDEYLPEHTNYLSTLSNKNKTIYGINFHETSNYNDVILIIVKGNELKIINNLFNEIKEILYVNRVIPNFLWDHQYLKIEKIEGNKIYCDFYGSSSVLKKTVHKKFELNIIISQERIHLSFAK